MIFEPKREVAPQDDGTFMVYVTPPEFFNMPRCSVRLTADQYDRYVRWRLGGGLIQEMLPDLSTSQREILMSGLDDDGFKQMVGSDD